MSATTETNLPSSLPIESTTPTTPDIPEVCKSGDKECVSRWIQAFSDCE